MSIGFVAATLLATRAKGVVSVLIRGLRVRSYEMKKHQKASAVPASDLHVATPAKGVVSALIRGLRGRSYRLTF